MAQFDKAVLTQKLFLTNSFAKQAIRWVLVSAKVNVKYFAGFLFFAKHKFRVRFSKFLAAGASKGV